MEEEAIDFLRHISWVSTPRNEDFSDSIIQEFNSTLETDGDLLEISGRNTYFD